MKIRGLKFPTFIVKKPNKRRSWFDAIYVEKVAQYYRVIFAFALDYYSNDIRLTTMGNKTLSKSFIGGIGVIHPHELRDDYRRKIIYGIFNPINEDRIRGHK